MDGLKFGVVIGILWVVPYALISYGVITIYSKKAIFMYAIYHLVEQGAGGIVIALIYGKASTESGQAVSGSDETVHGDSDMT